MGKLKEFYDTATEKGKRCIERFFKTLEEKKFVRINFE